MILADDHGVVREGLQRLLQTAGCQVVGCAGDGMSAVRMCEAMRPDVALLDVAMPLLNGIDAAREVRKVSPSTKILLLTMHTDEFLVLAGLRAGVSGYLLKSSAAPTIVQAIAAVSHDNVYLCPGISRTIVDACISRHPQPDDDALSLREREVLQLLAEGKNMKEIGDLLGISARTAETHRTRIMNKLDIHHVPGLVRYAIQRRLISVHTM